MKEIQPWKLLTISQFIVDLRHNPSCTEYFLDLLDVIEQHMIVVPSAHCKRWSSTSLVAALRELEGKAIQNVDYLHKPYLRNSAFQPLEPVEVVLHPTIAEHVLSPGRTMYTGKMLAPLPPDISTLPAEKRTRDTRVPTIDILPADTQGEDRPWSISGRSTMDSVS